MSRFKGLLPYVTTNEQTLSLVLWEPVVPSTIVAAEGEAWVVEGERRLERERGNGGAAEMEGGCREAIVV